MRSASSTPKMPLWLAVTATYPLALGATDFGNYDPSNVACLCGKPASLMPDHKVEEGP